MLEGYSVVPGGGVPEGAAEHRYALAHGYWSEAQLAREIISGESAERWRGVFAALWAPHPEAAPRSETLQQSAARHKSLLAASQLVWGEPADDSLSLDERWRACVRSAKEDTLARIASLHGRLAARAEEIRRTSLAAYIQRQRARLAGILERTHTPPDEEGENVYHGTLLFLAYLQLERRVRLREWLSVALCGMEYQGSFLRKSAGFEHGRLRE